VQQAAGTSEGKADPVKVEVPAGHLHRQRHRSRLPRPDREVQIPAGGQMALAFDLAAAPKKLLVVFKEDKIEILQQVHFEFAKATSPRGQLLAARPGGGRESCPTTSSGSGSKPHRQQGGKEKNQKLSEDRARSVATT